MGIKILRGDARMTERSGQQLGNYQVLRTIGQGSFADIYLGEHMYLKTQVAIKVLKAQVANEDDLEDFLKEARTIAHLVHPHIVRVLDFGIDDRMPFLVMDYAPNGTLHQRHKGMQVPLDRIVSYIKQIGAALQYAHDAKLIHRDVKPDNMLLGRNDDVLLSDFGIALITQSSRYQDTQDVIGTLAYMAPEQMQGRAIPASDQYSLGIVVYEWLTGQRPFHGSFTELCTQQMFAPPPDLREKIPNIAPEVEQVIMRVLAKDPTQRFESVQAFASALEQASLETETMIIGPKTALPPLASLAQAQVEMSAQKSVTPQIVLPAQDNEEDMPHIDITPAVSAQMAVVPQIVLSAQNDKVDISHINAASTSSATSPEIDAIPTVHMTGLADGEAGEQAKRGKKISVWGLIVRQVIAMIIGVVLCVGLGFVSEQRLPGSINFIPEFLIAVIFGVLFGPLVGLVSGGAGISILEAVSGPLVYVGFALVGFIAGLAKVIIPGRYNTFLRFVVAEIFGAMGIVISLGLIFYCTYVLYMPYHGLSLALNYLINDGSKGVVATLIVLPMILGIWNLLAWWMQRRRA
jgi:serine/threonine protein kinase